MARIVNNLPRFIDDVQRRGARGMLQALILGASEASVRTPIDTSALINSQWRDVRIEGSRVIGTVGYTVDYALPVHDPDNPQQFRRASATKEFLKLGFQDAAPNIFAVLSGAIRT